MTWIKMNCNELCMEKKAACITSNDSKFDFIFEIGCEEYVIINPKECPH